MCHGPYGCTVALQRCTVAPVWRSRPWTGNYDLLLWALKLAVITTPYINNFKTISLSYWNYLERVELWHVLVAHRFPCFSIFGIMTNNKSTSPTERNVDIEDHRRCQFYSTSSQYVSNALSILSDHLILYSYKTLCDITCLYLLPYNSTSCSNWRQ